MSATSECLPAAIMSFAALIGSAARQQGAEFYRDRPAKTDHLVSLVLDVPRKVHRRSELGRCNTDQGLRTHRVTETNIKIPDAAKTDPVLDSRPPCMPQRRW